jgi:EAL domain-containing protein (putative c-di-GMP-specific phosphodiesterase class I)/GGDEF domain-containing protein
MSEAGESLADLRYERDRFVAFAFASADAFLELDTDQVIQHASGAVQWLAGAKPEELEGKEMVGLVERADRPLLKAALSTAVTQGRFGPLGLRVSPKGRKPLRVVAFGTHLPIHGGRTFVALSARRLGEVSAKQQEDMDAETGLLEKGAFGEMAQKAMAAANEGGRPYNMTLLDLDGIDKLRERMDDDAADKLVANIAAHMKANSVNGDSAGRLDDDKFGLVHDADLDVSALQETIAATVKEADPKGEGLEVGSTTVDLEGEMSEADNARALLYTINKFSESHGDFTIDQLSDGYKQMLDETREKIATFKAVISEGTFDVLFQPIVDLSDRSIHHYEALARLRSMGPDSSPFQFITFAEEVGVIGDFDIAMSKKVIAKIKAARKKGERLSIAVNLSGRSLESPAFVTELHDILKSCDTIREELMFEVTESAKITDLESTNKFLQSLRGLGHHVCLDDFGAGAAAFQYLRALEVDYVKIDGIYVREAFTTPNGKVFLKSMASLCSDLAIQTVGEFVETEEVSDFLHQVGVNYGQGYLFGKPGMILSVKTIPKANTATG